MVFGAWPAARGPLVRGGYAFYAWPAGHGSRAMRSMARGLVFCIMRMARGLVFGLYFGHGPRVAAHATRKGIYYDSVQLTWGENEITVERTQYGWIGYGWIGRSGGDDLARSLGLR